MSVEIKGAEQLAALAKQLKDAGEKDLQRELNKAINKAVVPMRDAIKASARSTLPRQGGLNQKVARSKFRTVKRSGGVRLQATNSYGLAQLNKGTVRHPVFGNREVWVTQKVTPGFWDDPTEKAAPQVRRDIEAAVADVAKRIK